MSTAQLTAVRAGPSADSSPRSAAAVAVSVSITVALLAVILYAAFAHGGVSAAADTRIELAITVIAAAAVVPLLWTRSLRLAAPRTAAVAVGLLAAFALWSGISVLWSVAPNQTWLEVNHVITYILVLVLAMAIGASYSRSLELILIGFVLVAVAVTVYALGQKLFPGLHVHGLFDLNQTGPLPRLQEPLGYWNALALFIAIAVPAAVAVAADVTRAQRLRLAALCVVVLMLLAIVLTYSRGGLLALAVALAVTIWLSHDRLRLTMWLGVAVTATVPAVVLGLTSPQLTESGEGLSSRQTVGAALAVLLLLSLIAMLVVSRKLLAVEPRLRLEPRRLHRLRRLIMAAVALVLVGVVLALAFSSRGLTGTISHAWHTFTTTQPASNSDPQRLLSADSQNRWVWWNEAAGAFSDRPLGGWGAGSFAVVHLLYRHDNLTVQQPHSVPLQFLSETGIVGGILGVGAFVLLLRAGWSTAKRRPPGSERLLAGAALAGGLVYALHSLYDWDWEIPAVTLPALAFLGVLVSTRARVEDPETRPRRPSWPLGWRALCLAAATLWLGVFAVSVELPQLASTKANAALLDASSTSPSALVRAQSAAKTASALDPLSDAGLKAQATLAIHTGRLQNAKLYLQQSVRRDPSDVQAWDQLAYVDVLLREDSSALQAAQRVIALDPHGPNAANIVHTLLLVTPPQASPTAVPTPLRAP